QYNQEDVDKSNMKTPTFMLTGNRFDSNNNFVLHARMESCIITRIHNNNFVANNERSKSGTAIIEAAPDEHSKQFEVEISNNLWANNKGTWCLYIMANNQNPFNGSVHGNKFERNENIRGSLIVGSSFFRINGNEFNNHLEQFDLEVDFLQNDSLDAANNYWGYEDDESIEKRVLDGRSDHSRGIAKIRPINLKRAATIADDCVAVSNCSMNGQCIGRNQCLCESGFAGEDCSRISCLSLNNCSTNGY
uniref:EGF-like domain-containing protein n=1 Tax=Parascaris univalens TaxID=6257 RepID=A0A914ZSC9_PARUN